MKKTLHNPYKHYVEEKSFYTGIACQLDREILAIQVNYAPLLFEQMSW